MADKEKDKTKKSKESSSKSKRETTSNQDSPRKDEDDSVDSATKTTSSSSATDLSSSSSKKKKDKKKEKEQTTEETENKDKEEESTKKTYEVSILGTELVKQKGAKAFTVYKVEITYDITTWIIYRRYSEFYQLLVDLKSEFGSLVPKKFPPKQILQNLSPHKIDRRHQMLQDWLKAVLDMEELEQHKKTQHFIKLGKEDADFVPRQRSTTIESDIEMAGSLFKLHNGSWKQRWFVLRHNCLYKYASPKHKHPFGFYGVADCRAAPLDFGKLEEEQSSKKEEKIEIKDKDSKSHVFYVDAQQNSKAKRYIFAAESEDVMNKWISRLNKDRDVLPAKQKEVKVFGVPLDAVRDRDSAGVPLFISALLTFIEATALDEADLFTKPPDEEIKRQIDRGKVVDLSKVVQDIHAVAGLIVQYLHELPEPIIPQDCHECFFGIFKIKDELKRHKMITSLAEILPVVNRNLLIKLFSFLHTASKRAVKMERISRIFGRLVFRPKQEFDNEQINNITVEIINNPQLFLSEAEQARLEEDAADELADEDVEEEEIQEIEEVEVKRTKSKKDKTKKRDKKDRSKRKDKKGGKKESTEKTKAHESGSDGEGSEDEDTPRKDRNLDTGAEGDAEDSEGPDNDEGSPREDEKPNRPKSGPSRELSTKALKISSSKDNVKGDDKKKSGSGTGEEVAPPSPSTPKVKKSKSKDNTSSKQETKTEEKPKEQTKVDEAKTKVDDKPKEEPKTKVDDKPKTEEKPKEQVKVDEPKTTKTDEKSKEEPKTPPTTEDKPKTEEDKPKTEDKPKEVSTEAAPAGEKTTAANVGDAPTDDKKEPTDKPAATEESVSTSTKRDVEKEVEESEEESAESEEDLLEAATSKSPRLVSVTKERAKGPTRKIPRTNTRIVVPEGATPPERPPTKARGPATLHNLRDIQGTAPGAAAADTDDNKPKIRPPAPLTPQQQLMLDLNKVLGRSISIRAPGGAPQFPNKK